MNDQSDSRAPLLRATAGNYEAGHMWDRLDAEVVATIPVRKVLEASHNGHTLAAYFQELHKQLQNPLNIGATGMGISAEQWKHLETMAKAEVDGHHNLAHSTLVYLISEIKQLRQYSTERNTLLSEYERATKHFRSKYEQQEKLNADIPAITAIVEKMRSNLEAVGGFDNGFVSVPAAGVRYYIEQLESVLRRVENVSDNDSTAS